MILYDKQNTASSTGCLSKAWYMDNGRLYLVKGNMLYEDGHIGCEPYVEAIASIVAGVLNIPHVPYILAPASLFKDVKVYKCDCVSVCESIKVPAGVQRLSATEYIDLYYGKRIYANYWAAIRGTPVDKKSLCDMLLFDAIIGNNDRHLNNWEYTVSQQGVFQLPIYDNGSSLLTFDKKLPHSIHKIGRDKAKPFAKTHFEQITLIKRNFPEYRFNINKEKSIKLITERTKPIFELIDDKYRAELMYEYLIKRFRYYIDYINGGI